VPRQLSVLRGETDANGRREDRVGTISHLPPDAVGQKGVGAQREMAVLVLDRAERDDHRPDAVLDQSAQRRRGEPLRLVIAQSGALSALTNA
jgi:hypothetical protein